MELEKMQGWTTHTHSVGKYFWWNDVVLCSKYCCLVIFHDQMVQMVIISIKVFIFIMRRGVGPPIWSFESPKGDSKCKYQYTHKSNWKKTEFTEHFRHTQHQDFMSLQKLNRQKSSSKHTENILWCLKQSNPKGT